MRALILAAGRGERMRPLTDVTPKPLLTVAGKRLIEWQIEALARAGVVECVVNTAHCPQQIEDALENGARYGVRVAYSREGERADEALETLGGIVRALPLLGQDPFVVVSGDIVTDFDYRELTVPAAALATGAVDAHLVLVANPSYHAQGDMALRGGLIDPDGTPRLTYANIGMFAPRLFAGLEPTRARLFPWLYDAARRGRVSGAVTTARWHNVGTPADLAALDRGWQRRGS
jgi:MurNAc alpha-1-phosphate uridylyltransferase